MNLGTSQVIRANSRHLPLADDSVDLVVTSPPYFALRSYQDGGEHYAGQIGDEPTPAEFVESLIEVTRECVRVLKPSGSMWVNLGDKYSPAKSLMGVPWRYALRCVDDLGLILRADVVWSKANGLPESATDRVRRSHEQWFHFTQQSSYFSAVDEIREPLGGLGLGKLPGSVWTVPTQPLRVPEHLGVDHFAAFPMEWPRRIIRGWSPSGLCTKCGEGRRPMTEKVASGKARADAGDGGRGDRLPGYADVNRSSWAEGVTRSIVGQGCACGTFDLMGVRLPVLTCGAAFNPSVTTDGPIKANHTVWRGSVDDRNVTPLASHGARVDQAPPTRPAVILDPFGGTGTTALVAKALGRHGVSVDMSADYCRLAEWRTNDPDQLAVAMQVDKPTKQVEGQADLFDMLAG